MTSSRRSATPDEDGLLVGRIVGPFGLRGEVKLLPETDYPERLTRLASMRLRFPGGREEERAVRGTRPHKGMLLVRFEGCDNPDDAEALRGVQVWIRGDQAAPLPEGEYYVHQILGLRVVTETGEELGTVDEVIPTGANHVYRVGKLLIPATHDAIVRLDPPAGIIITRSRAYLEGEEAR